MKSVVAGILGLCAVSSVAAAEDHAEIGGMFILASETGSSGSTGHPGGLAEAMTWFGQIALQVEVGHHGWAWDGGVDWAGIGARVAFYDSSTCGRQCAGYRAWLDVGIAREKWTLDEPDFETQSRTRNVQHVGFGADVIARRGWIGGGTFWLRFTKGDPTEPAYGTYGEITEPYTSNLMFGIGVLFGGS